MQRSWQLISPLVLLAAIAAGAAAVLLPLSPPPDGVVTQAPPPPTGEGRAQAVVIHKPDGPPTVQTGLFDAQGQPITASCSTCHSTKEPQPEITSPQQLEHFHRGLHMQHGELSCLSCHNSDDYDTLRLADGRKLEFENVMQLCAQCHGPQHRDYQDGSHGGMSGHWDLSRGGRERNNCIDCHDPHAPAYPQVMPVFPPLDGKPAHEQGAAH